VTEPVKSAIRTQRQRCEIKWTKRSYAHSVPKQKQLAGARLSLNFSITSKSQLYRHFPDKDALVHAVIALCGEQVLQRESQRLGQVRSYLTEPSAAAAV